MNPSRAYFILSVWAEEQSYGTAVWRGCLESAAGKRFHFASLETLNELLKYLGWSDAPQSSPPVPSPRDLGAEGE